MLLKSVFGADQPFFADFNTLIDNLGPAVGPLIVAAVVAAAVTPAAIALSRMSGLIAVPDGVRHRHLRPTPLLGGSVLAAAFTVGVIVFHPPDVEVLSLIFLCLLTALLFLLDDRAALPPLAKFGLQLLVSLLAV